jgi:hypothetical protein
MLRLLTLLVTVTTGLLRSRRDLLLENLALRQQLAAFDLLDHVIVLNERHLKRLMNEYLHYYHEDRTHLGLAKETPNGRNAETSPGSGCKVDAMPRVGGLHHRYRLAA